MRKQNNKQNAKLIIYKQPSSIEPKIKDFFQTSHSFLGGGVITHFSDVSQGTSFNERVGYHINIKSLQIRADLYRATGMTFARILFVIDRQQTAGFPPAVTDILSPPANTSTSLNWYNRKRFTILSDNTYALHAAVECIPIIHKIKLPNVPTLFAGSSGTPQSNGLYMLTISNLPLTPAYMDYSVRIRYSDD